MNRKITFIKFYKRYKIKINDSNINKELGQSETISKLDLICSTKKFFCDNL